MVLEAHVAHFISVKDTVGECYVDVELLDLPVQCSTKVREDTEGLHACSRGGSLGVILTVNSGIPTTNITCFEVEGVATFVTLDLEYRLITHDATASRDR